MNAEAIACQAYDERDESTLIEGVGNRILVANDGTTLIAK